MADESVDVEQLAALERVMYERDAVPQWTAHPYVGGASGLCAKCGLAIAAKVHIVEEAERWAGSTPAGPEQPENPAGSRERGVAPPAPLPPRPLASFVEAGAVDTRLAVMQNELAQLRGMLHHVMVLVMVMGDRQKISAQEYDAAAVLIAKAEKDGPR